MAADLRYGMVSWSGFTFVRGQLPSAQFTIHNDSGTAVFDKFTSTLYLSKDNIIDSGDYIITNITLNGIQSNHETDNIRAQYQVPLDIDPGEYYLILSVDVHDDVVEENENNNLFFQNDGTGFWEPITIAEPPAPRIINLPLPFNSGTQQVLLTQPPNTDFTHKDLFAEGYDFDLAVGDLLLAIAESRIVHYRDDLPTLGLSAGDTSGTGNYVTLVVNEGQPNQYYITYMHLAQGSVSEFISQRDGGQNAVLGIGEVVGRVGASGLSSTSGGDGSHLHIQIGGSLNFGSSSTYAVNDGGAADVEAVYPEPHGTAIYEGNLVPTYIGTTPVVFTSVDGEYQAGPEEREINLSPSSEEIPETVSGTVEEHNGDTIFGFSAEDTLIFKGVDFARESLKVTFGSAVLDIDVDLDGIVDSTVTLSGDFDKAEFVVSNVNGDTHINAVFAQEEYEWLPDTDPLASWEVEIGATGNEFGAQIWIDAGTYFLGFNDIFQLAENRAGIRFRDSSGDAVKFKFVLTEEPFFLEIEESGFYSLELYDFIPNSQLIIAAYDADAPDVYSNSLLYQRDTLPNPTSWHGQNVPVGNPILVTYSFNEDPALGSYAHGATEEGFVALDAGYQDMIRSVLAATTSATGITFIEVDPDLTSLKPMISFQGNSEITGGVAGYAGLPSYFNTSKVTLRIGELATPDNMLHVAVHEIGHALGLRHPHESSGVYPPIDDPLYDRKFFTTMSYSGYGHHGREFRELDFLALAKLYGLPQENGFGFIHDANELVVIGTNVGDVITGTYLRDTIGGGLGDDSIDGRLGDDILFSGDGNDLVYGGPGNDFLYSESGNSVLVGGIGDDTIIGSYGDVITVGGNGRDTIVGGVGTSVVAGEVVEAYVDPGFTTVSDHQQDIFVAPLFVPGQSAEMEVLDFRFENGPAFESDLINLAPFGIRNIEQLYNISYIIGNDVHIESVYDSQYKIILKGAFSIENLNEENVIFDNDYISPITIVGQFFGLGEGSGPGSTIAQFYALDPNFGDTITYSLVDDFAGIYVIDPRTGRVALTEESATYDDIIHNIEVVATDQTGLSISKMFNLTLLGSDQDKGGSESSGDIETSNTLSIVENSDGGQFIGRFMTNIDLVDEPAEYYLVEDASGLFAIDGSDLVVADDAVIDYEVAVDHTVRVVSVSSTGVITGEYFEIAVTNMPINDIALVSGGSVRENAATDTVVAIFEASENPVEPTAVFSIVSGGDGKFYLDGNELKVSPGAAFDFDNQSNYSITFSTTDGTGPAYEESFDIFVEKSGPIVGTPDEDILNGTQFDDVIQALGSDDIINASFGDDDIDGGEGTDTVVYARSRDQVTHDWQNDGTIVITRTALGDGTDTLVNIERIDFNDGSLLYGVDTPNLGFGYRIYQASFDRTPDEGGVLFWIGNLDHFDTLGWSQYEKEQFLATQFIQSDEFKDLFGANPTNEQYIDAMYLNVLDRLPDQGGYDFWVGGMEQGLTREDILIAFTKSDENVARTAPDLDDGVWVV